MNLFPGDTKGKSRLRTYMGCGLNLMFTRIKDERFNSFVRFAFFVYGLMDYTTIFSFVCLSAMKSIPQANFPANFELGLTILQNGVMASKSIPVLYSS